MNYICVECPFHNNLNRGNINQNNFTEFKICFFSHNLTEMLYHPFFYKTILCPKVNKSLNNCTQKNCFYAHDFKEDFRLLPRLEKEEIKELIIQCIKSEVFGFNFIHNLPANLNKIENFTKKHEQYNSSVTKEFISNLIGKRESQFKYEILPSEFNPLTYKIYKCPLEKQCKLDVKLCLNYHDYFDRRRNPREFKYGKKVCKNVFDKEKKIWKNLKYCPKVIYIII